jgi:apolipoprotein N-acyltransferase
VALAPERAGFILLITNDAWFGHISGPYQHLAQARLRSVEQGLPMIRVANTGVTAMIDAHGQIRAFLPLGTSGYIDAALPAALPPTLYSKTGDLPLLVLLVLALGGAFVTRRRIAPLSD